MNVEYEIIRDLDRVLQPIAEMAELHRPLKLRQRLGGTSFHYISGEGYRSPAALSGFFSGSVDDDGEHPDRYLLQPLGAMRHVSAEGEGIARAHHVGMAPMAIVQDAGEQMDELDARMLESRKHFAPVVQRHEEGFEYLPGATLSGEQVIGMSAPGSAAYCFQALARPDQLRTAVVGPHPPHEHRGRHAQGLSQGDDGLEAGRDPPGLETAQHGARDIRAPRYVGKRQVLTLAQPPRRAAEVERRTVGTIRGRRLEPGAGSSPGIGAGNFARRLFAVFEVIAQYAN